MRLMTIASGSSGNAGYLGSERTHLLIDAGISRRRIVQGLEAADLKPADLAGVLLNARTCRPCDRLEGLTEKGSGAALCDRRHPGSNPKEGGCWTTTRRSGFM